MKTKELLVPILYPFGSLSQSAWYMMSPEGNDLPCTEVFENGVIILLGRKPIVFNKTWIVIHCSMEVNVCNH